MANLTHGTNWNGTVSQTRIQKTYTFPTSAKYVDKDIAFTVSVPGVTLQKGETFYIEGPAGTGPRFVWTCDAITGEITITGSN